MTLPSLNRKGQVTIPKAIRDSLRLEAGDRVLFIAYGERVTLKAVRGNILELRGSVPVPAKQDFDEVRREAKRRAAGRIARTH